jgi:catechol 2,3-dioxygenase-like lactoylglutathione lyase family enzyme
VSSVRFENSIPILRVSDLEKSLEYYVGVLGFGLDWQSDTTMASVSRDGCSVMLCENGQGNPGTWVWFGVTDAGELFQEYRAAGAKVRLEPTNYPWACEMRIEDPDGHVLRFGSEPKQPV